jgi:hypothetical protein
MLSEIGSRLEGGELNSEEAKEASEEMSLSLAALRSAGDISNDAYLDAGVIQGGISVLSNMIDQGCKKEELLSHMNQLRQRADRICLAHPELAEYFE